MGNSQPIHDHSNLKKGLPMKMLKQDSYTVVLASMGTLLAGALSACALDPDQNGDDGDAAGQASETTEARTSGAASDDLAAVNAAVLAKPVGTGAHCAVLLDKLQPGQTESRVVSYTCADSEQALASLQPAASVKLMTVFQNSNFGIKIKDFFGAAGPCDASGYSINNVGADANDRISSFQTFSNCNHTVAFVDINQGGGSQGYNGTSISFVGNAMNDRISSFHTNHQ
jgi:hypothetical protein